MSNNRKLKIKTDLENLHMLHRLNRIYNSPKTFHGPRYYQQNNSENKRYNNYTRTIVLQKTTPIAYYPVKIKLLKKNRNDYSYSPEGRSHHSPSYSRYNNNSFINNSLNKDKNNVNIENDISKNRNYNDINNNIDNLKYKNLGQINKLKISLGNPKDARNIMINNNERNNRFISVSPSQNSNKDDIRDKNNDYLRYNDINIENNYDGKHQIRYLLSKEYMDKFKNINKNQNFNNNYRQNNYNYYNNRSYSNRYFQKKSEDYYLNKYNMESSPGNKSSNTYKAKPGNNLINNNIQIKKQTPNITPIINDNTPYMLPQDKIIQEEIELNNYNNYSNPNNIFLNNNPNYIYKIIEIKLDDLIFIEGRFNDIILSLNNNRNIFDIGAINESVEFFVFYFHSSLKNKLSLFFSEPNRIIIKSAFNLNLYIIMITYHLSLNPSMLVKVILLLRQIYNLLKKNLFLIIRKIELYYGDDFCRKNEIYFKTCNYFLCENGLVNINENEIISIISRNCVSIVNDIKNILNYYQTIDNRYYNDFKDIFLNISRLGEQDLNNYFYNYLFNSSQENIITQQRIINNRNEYSIDNIENSNYIEANANNNIYNCNNTSDYNNNNNSNINNNYLRASQNESINKEQEEDDEQFLDDIILSYKKNKEIPPFLKNKNQKKYTLVLDLEDTLISVKLINEGKILIRPRPGLISFLTGVKPYYEIISFSKLSKNYSSIIIEQIEENRKLFDYNLYREHCSLIGRKFVKDISRIGRDMKKIIMVDDLPENLDIHVDNGILILPYDGDENKEDRVLYELKKILILFYNLGYEDLRNAIKSYKNEIYQKITLGLPD